MTSEVLSNMPLAKIPERRSPEHADTAFGASQTGPVHIQRLFEIKKGIIAVTDIIIFRTCILEVPCRHLMSRCLNIGMKRDNLSALFGMRVYFCEHIIND